MKYINKLCHMQNYIKLCKRLNLIDYSHSSCRIKHLVSWKKYQYRVFKKGWGIVYVEIPWVKIQGKLSTE